ncbi:DUF1643 domain-containing protein [Lacticaseibacillus saniviri]
MAEQNNHKEWVGMPVSKSSLLEQKVTITTNRKGAEQFWTKWLWDDNAPVWLVICNYILGELPAFALDTTKLLIINHARNAGAGGVIVGNLFSRPIKAVSDAELAKAGGNEGLKELVEAAKTAQAIIIGTGSLPATSKVAKKRLDQLVNKLAAEKVTAKVSTLVNDDTYKPAHPLSLQGKTWMFKSGDTVTDKLF